MPRVLRPFGARRCDGPPRRDAARHDHREPHDGDWTGLFWRFIAAGNPAADAVVFRDADSRLTARERSAVDEWVASVRAVHVMRDHPEHPAPILGGMWGIRRGAAINIRELMDAFKKADRWQTDQDFLARTGVAAVRADAVEHDEYFARRSFPTPRVGRTFVGQPFDEHDHAGIEGPTATEHRVRQMARRRLEAVGARPPLPRF